MIHIKSTKINEIEIVTHIMTEISVSAILETNAINNSLKKY